MRHRNTVQKVYGLGKGKLTFFNFGGGGGGGGGEL